MQERSRKITVRLTEQEYAHLKMQATNCGMKMEPLIRRALLVGKIYCAHCGNRLTLTTSGRRKLDENGVATWISRPRHQCHYKVRRPGECDGQSGYGVPKLDDIIDKVIRTQLEQIRDAPGRELVKRQHEKSIGLAEARVNILRGQLREKENELADYQNEILKIIRGQSRLNVDMLNELVAQTKTEYEKLKAEYTEAERQLEEAKETFTGEEEEECENLSSWAEVYDHCSLETKKMFVSYFIKAIYVHRDYNMDVEFNVSFDDFKYFSVR